MKPFVVVALLVNSVLSAHLGNTYIPPPNNALTAGGSNFLQTPHPGGPSHTSHFASGGISNFGGGGGSGAGFGASAGHFSSGGQGGFASNQQQGSFGHQQASYQQSSGQQIPIIRYENHPNAGDGTYSFLYETGNGINHQEQGHLKQIGSESGIAVQGQFSYTGDDGKLISLQYTADENGFQPVGDHLPTPPPIPPEIQKSLELIAAQGGRHESGQYNQGSYNSGQYQGGNQGGYGGGGHGGASQGGFAQTGFSQGGQTHVGQSSFGHGGGQGSQGGFGQSGFGHGGQAQGGFGQTGFGGQGSQGGFGQGGHTQSSFSSQSTFSHGGNKGSSFGASATNQQYLPPTQQAFSPQTGYHY